MTEQCLTPVEKVDEPWEWKDYEWGNPSRCSLWNPWVVKAYRRPLKLLLGVSLKLMPWYLIHSSKYNACFDYYITIKYNELLE